MRVDDEIREWIYSFVKDEDEAEGLTNQILNQVHTHYHDYGKIRFATGIMVGIFITLILVRWFA